jgi:hypothetical protein
MQFESPTLRLNRLLRSSLGARRRLPFAGGELELRAPPLPALRFSSRSRRPACGRRRSAASLTITAGSARSPPMRGEEQLLREIEVASNARWPAR